MNDYELAKAICSALERAEKESRGNIYILTADTFQKMKQLEELLCETNCKIEFDRLSNSIEISLSGFVLDSQKDNLKLVFQIVDLFVIDALNNGKVYIEMKILNAAKIMRR